MSYKKRAQISIEYLIVIAFVTFVVLSILGVAFFYSSQIQDTMKFNQLERFSQKIITSAESIYYSGEPSKTIVQGYMPKGVSDIEVLGNEIVFNVTTNSGMAVISYTSKVDLEGNISKTAGVKRVKLVAETDRVVISEA